MKYYNIVTFGCQMNVNDSERVATVLESLGFLKTNDLSKADIVIVNICSVRQQAFDRVYGIVQKVKKLKKIKDIQVGVTGCILDSDKKILEKKVDFLFNINDLKKLPKLISNKNEIDIGDYFSIKPRFFNDYVAYIPIMTGCNNFCSYCVVPYTRGRERSRDAEEIIQEAKLAIQKGFKEIWLIGQNVNSYKNEKYSFADLLREIDNIPGDYWLNFSSSHPKDFTLDIISVMKNGKHITPLLHLPVQSGSDKVLRDMNRPYTIDKYIDIVKKAKQEIKDLCISTDIIVGFCGESKEDYLQTKEFIKDMKFDIIYLAQYSSRKGTYASENLKDDVSFFEKKRRWHDLNKTLKEINLENNKKYLNQEYRVIVFEKKGNNCLGKTSFGKIIKFKSDKVCVGCFCNILVNKTLSLILEGEFVSW